MSEYDCLEIMVQERKGLLSKRVYGSSVWGLGLPEGSNVAPFGVRHSSFLQGFE